MASLPVAVVAPSHGTDSSSFHQVKVSPRVARSTGRASVITNATTTRSDKVSMKILRSLEAEDMEAVETAECRKWIRATEALITRQEKPLNRVSTNTRVQARLPDGSYPVAINSRTATAFTEEKAKLLRQKMRETDTYHDTMYHSALASRLA